MMTGIVLAGGRSSRMGAAKALLPFAGEPLIVHIVRTLQPLFLDLMVVAAPGQVLPPMAVRVVYDEVAHRGPVGGLCYGLKAAAGEFAFVSSCDSPFLSVPLIAHLLSLRHNHDVVVPRWHDRVHPLLAVYRKTVVPLLESQLEKGDLRLVHLLDQVDTRVVDEIEIRQLDPQGDSFFNMNYLEDYGEALTRWRKKTENHEP